MSHQPGRQQVNVARLSLINKKYFDPSASAQYQVIPGDHDHLNTFININNQTKNKEQETGVYIFKSVHFFKSSLLILEKIFPPSMFPTGCPRKS